MDKYEFNLKVEQLKKLIEKRDFAVAAKIADTIEWEKVKNNSLLTTVADVYEVNGEYQKSKDILEIAYDRSSAGRQLAYKLTVLSAKLGQIGDARLFYEDYVDMAPKNTSRYLLEYEIAKAEEAPVTQLISILEAYLEEDMDEKWSYVLAVLYHKAGMGQKCVELCDTIILWFNDGKFVYRALELKMLYTPLTPEQQEKYETYKNNNTPQRMKYNVDAKKEASALAGNTIVASAGPVAVKNNDDTANDEETDNVKKDTAEEEAAVTVENAETESTAAEENDFDDEEAEKKPDDIDISLIKVKEIDVNSKYNTVNIQAEIAKSMSALLGDDYDGFGDLEEPTRELSEIDRQIYNRPLKANVAMKDNMNQIFAVNNDPIDPLYELEGDGQIGISVEEAPKDDDQLEGQLTIEDILAEYERRKDQPEEEVSVAEEPEIVESEEEAEAEAEEEPEEELGEVAEVPEEVENAEPEETAEEESEEEPEVSDEAENTVADNSVEFAVDISGIEEILRSEEEVAMTDDETDSEEDSVEATEDETEETVEAETEEAVEEEPVDESKEEAESVETEPAELVEEAVEEEPVDESEEEAESAEPEQAESTEQAAAETPKPSTPTSPEDLKKELKGFIAKYGSITGLDNNIIKILENLVKNFDREGTSKVNNVFITGEIRSGKTTMARDLIKLTNKIRHRDGRRIAKTHASILNKKGIKTAFKSLEKSDVIIEKAGSLSGDSVHGLKEVLNEYTGGMLVVLEDDKAAMEQMFATYPELKEMFGNVFGIKEFSLSEWAKYAEEYVAEEGYVIDEMAMLALHAKIDVIYAKNRTVTREDVEELMDEVMAKSNKGLGRFFKRLFTKNKENEKIVIREDDFY